MQQAGESFEQFLTELKLLVKDCGHADPDEMVRDRVVIGCYSSKAWEKLIHEGSDLTLEKAFDIARKEEIWVIVKKTSPKNLSVDCRSTVGRLSTDSRPTVGRLSAVCRPTVGRLLADSRPSDGQQILPEI